LADFVSASAIEKYNLSLDKFMQARGLSISTLWEGSPALPVQPSPMIFRFFKDLAARMSSCGGDVWATGAVAAVKDTAGNRVCAMIQHAINGTSPNADVDENMQKDDELTDEQKGIPKQTEKATQLLFDLCYAGNALQSATKDGDTFLSAIKDVTLASGLKDIHLARLQKSATEYWRRTYLMFALLASS
jgi:hypothetical protein